MFVVWDQLDPLVMKTFPECDVLITLLCFFLGAFFQCQLGRRNGYIIYGYVFGPHTFCAKCRLTIPVLHNQLILTVN